LGFTPNPDVLCNKEIKFGAFVKYISKKDKNAFIATGHHARIKKIGDTHFLFRGRDDEKDQAYFLWMIDKHILSKTLMPIGDITKKEVRSIAKLNDIYSADKKDSQGLCFMGAVNMKEFLSHFISLKEGKLYLESKEIGTHPGAEIFTIGQRHGFTVTDTKYSGKTLYVVKKDIKSNHVFVSQNPLEINKSHIIKLKNINIFTDLNEKEYIAETRYHGIKLPVKVMKYDNSSIEIKFLNQVSNVTKGQSVVLYKNEMVVAGGVIV